MANSMASPSLPRVLPRISRWVLVCGLIVGSLLGVLAGALPERVQSVALWLGIGFMLACIAGMLARLARDAELEWRGISPVVGMLIGALPYLSVAAWHQVTTRHEESSSRGPVLAAIHVAAPAVVPPPLRPQVRAAAPASIAPAPMPGSPRAQSQPNADPLPQSGDEEPVEPVTDTRDPADYEYRPLVRPGLMSRRARQEAASQR
jgi:hypothetical protein